MKIGIIGAGRLGQALARRLVGAGHEVMLSNSRGHDAVREIARTVGCLGGSAEDAAAFGEIAVVSVPLSALNRLPVDAIGAKITMDTCNFYPARDGVHLELEGGGETTSGLLQKALAKAIVVKAFNSVLAPHLAKGGAAPADGARHALPTASDDADAAAVVGRLVDDTGFEPVFIGPIRDSWRFERARPGYCRVLGAAALRQVLAETKPDSFVPEGSWRS